MGDFNWSLSHSPNLCTYLTNTKTRNILYNIYIIYVDQEDYLSWQILIGLSSSLLTFALILQTHRLEIYCIIYIYEYIDQVDYLSWQILIGLSHSPNLCTYLANRLEMSQMC